MIIYTESRSIYQVDTTQKRLRRLQGAINPTPRIGKDGEWKSYSSLYPDPIVIGKSMIIIWGSDVPYLDPEEPGAKTTQTSFVVKIELEN